jgi:dUTP pyrophosphatase
MFPAELFVQKLSNTAKLPEKAHPSDAGWDLFSDEPDFTLKPGERKIVSTGIAIQIMPPRAYFALIKDRSGWAANQGLHVLAGVIDPDYTGEIKVVLVNLGKNEVTIPRGAKIAQMVLIPLVLSSVRQVEKLPTLSVERGKKGFGSSGS